MRFDMTDLRLFLHVAEAGALTAGAARANMALASASERVSGMEAAAGVALLERRHRGVELTSAGRALAHHARLIVEASERMHAELGQYGRGLRGHVRLLANGSACSEHLTAELASFLAQRPEIDVELIEATSRDTAEAVAAGRAEFGVMSDRVDTGALDTRFFRRDDLVLVCARDHPFGARRRISFAEALTIPHVGTGGSLDVYLSGQARRLGRAVPVRVAARGFDGACLMVGQGVGVSVLPLAAARRVRRAAGIRIVALEDGWAGRSLVVVTRPNAPLAPPVQALVDWLFRDEASASDKARGP